MQSKVRITVLAAGFGNRHSAAGANAAGALRQTGILTGTDFEKVAPLNIDDIEVPAFLRYRSS